jgi:flavin-dependent dehydrogenase
MSFDCDVVVVGGGPAGSTAAAALARAGRQVILLERDRFPRFHIGESLLASVNDVLDAIGARDLVMDAGFPRKWGATFIPPDGSTPRCADFAVGREVPQPQTWQVCRATFDELLLRHAGRCGAIVRERHRVSDVSFDDDGVTVTVVHVRGNDQAGAASTPGSVPEMSSIRARVLVDASGRAAVLAHRFALRTVESKLANVAVFSHFAGVPRLQGRRAGDIRIVGRADRGWCWLIPISEELTSVGVVLPHAAFKPLSRTDPEELLLQLIAETPPMARLMAGAERRWPVHVERDFSYGAKAYAGDRWIIIGDAGSFLDPVFSTGVAIALESGVEGARAIDAGLSRGDVSLRAFRTFNRRQRARYRSFRRFVVGFYTNAFRDVFFSADPPKQMFRAVVTMLAGYWRPSWMTRFWVSVFLLIVWMQARFGLLPSHIGLARADEPPASPARELDVSGG